MTSEINYKHSELTETIIGVFYDVYNELGFGFLESVYRKALRMALMEKGLRVESELPITVFFRGEKVGDFRADLIVNGVVLLELKTVEKIIRAHEAQLLNYLRSTTLELGLILNFGPQPQIRKLVLDNSRKNIISAEGSEQPLRFSMRSVFISVISGKVSACA
jgi:GxxExxY protein